MSKAINIAKYSSDEASTSLYATLEPQAVQNFVVRQNGEYVELYWNQVILLWVILWIGGQKGINFERMW